MSMALESVSPVAAGGISFLPDSAVFESPVERREISSGGDECSTSSSSTISSIGKNSDLSGGDENCEDDGEVQSRYKRTFDSMDSLEEALPMRRGISKFYNGKSKSFTSLAEASSSSSIVEIAKPENPYSRKRRNLLAFSQIINKNRSFPLKFNGGGISKRPISTSKSSLALAAAMSSCESTSSTSEDSPSTPNSRSPLCLPPLHPRSRGSYYDLVLCGSPDFSPWRSFSVADLQHCVSTNYDKTRH